MSLPGIIIEGGINIGPGISIGASVTPPPTPSPYEGSGVFNGAAPGTFLDVAETAGFSFGTSNFTIEAWIYPTGAGCGAAAGPAQTDASRATPAADSGRWPSEGVVRTFGPHPTDSLAF